MDSLSASQGALGREAKPPVCSEALHSWTHPLIQMADESQGSVDSRRGPTSPFSTESSPKFEVPFSLGMLSPSSSSLLFFFDPKAESLVAGLALPRLL